MADLRKWAGEADRLTKLAEGSAAGQVADGLARPQEQAKGGIASTAGAASGCRGQVGKVVAEDMEILEQDVFGKGSVFDPHHVQPLDTFGTETKKRPPYDPELLGAMLDQYCAGCACKPEPEQLVEWARAGKVPDSRHRTTVREFFTQLDGEDMLDLTGRGGMSLHQIARLMVHCEVTHWLPVEFVNQWSELGSNPLPEGVEKLAMHGGLYEAL